MYFANARKKSQKLKSYFDDDDDDEPISSSSTAVPISSTVDDDDYDPLDAFMATVNETVKKEAETMGQSTSALPEIVSGLDEDYDEEYYSSMVDDANVNPDGNGDAYDSDGLPISGRKPAEKTKVEPLPPVNHSQMNYKPFRKNFYKENAQISSLTDDEVTSIREDLQVAVMGASVPRPVLKFDKMGLPSQLLKEISRVGYEAPTAIQAQALPVILSGKDIIGLAKTGSGKTLAFVWPMLIHILDQPRMVIGEGPIGMILSPTRELAGQIYTEAKKFAKVFNISVCAIFGGSGKWEMSKALKEAPEMVVATPGRFIELAKTKATNLERCTMVVLDEADRMFEMGFEYQMRSIVNNIRPNRQTLLFSATMKKKVEGFAREILTDPIRIVVGTIGQANPDIQQLVEVVLDSTAKLSWLTSRADEFVAEGKVLVFVLNKTTTEDLTSRLRAHFQARQFDIGIDYLHGDMDQDVRSTVMRKFGKTQETSILVATDIASRGLDIKDIRTVINYDIAKNIETYVHRIGRTGRMGVDGVVPGTAYTLLTPENSRFAVDLVHNLRLSQQPVPSQLQHLAESDPKWSTSKYNAGEGSRGGLKSGIGGAGLGSGGMGFVPAGSTGSSGGRSMPVRAMTSAMLAEDSRKKGMGNTFVVPAGVEKVLGGGVGRGRIALEGVGGFGRLLKLCEDNTNNNTNNNITNNSSNNSSSSGGSTIMTNNISVSSSTSSGSAPNPYVEGQSKGRGKHLTQPSWMTDTVSESKLESVRIDTESSHVVHNDSVSQPLNVEAPSLGSRKRVSRFSDAPTDLSKSIVSTTGNSHSTESGTKFTASSYNNSASSSSSTHSSFGYSTGSGVVMKGFVRSAGSDSMTENQPLTTSSTEVGTKEPRKKSRWDS